MATTFKPLYGTSTGLTMTLASLASSATAGRSCVAVTNVANLFQDADVTLGVKTSTSALSNDKACYLYFYGSEDAIVFGASSAEAVGTDQAVTLDNPTNLRGPVVISCPATGVTYRVVVRLSTIFGFLIPSKWGIVLRNFTGTALDSTENNHQKSYTGIQTQGV